MRMIILFLVALACLVLGWAAMRDEGTRHSQKLGKSVQMTFRTFLDRLNEIPDLLITSAKKGSKHIRMESANNLAKNLYSYKQKAEGDKLHTVVIAIKPRNMEALERILHEVSDPSNVKYGQHLTNDEVGELTGNRDSTEYVISYLQENGVTEIVQTPQGDYITASAPIRIFERILNCEFYDYSAKNNENFVITRTSEYFLEEHLVGHVKTIFHTVHFPPTHYLDHYHKRKSLGKLNTMANLAGYVTPQVLKDLYNIDISLGSSRTSQAVYESIGQTMSASDLAYFQHYFNLTVQTVSTVIGGHSSDRVCKQNPDDCVEANLDVQYMMAVAPHVLTTYYYWGGQDFMVDWLVQVAAMHSPPKVISISYGMDEQYLTTSYANAFNTQAIKVGVQGVTLTASSGDDGAPGSSARANSFMCGYHPSFPASSPYVTAVGGTMGPEVGEDETACQSDHGGIITTGGGFSYLYDMPSWQVAQVQSYRSTVEGTDLQPLRGFNMHGRGYPDISALAYNYVIAVGGELTAVSGTSASSPVFAGMVSLVNSARVAAGHSTLGWLNPALYQFSSSFVRDITSGDNRCGADAMVCCGHGFFATEGWDPVTGLGSIDFPSFKNTMLSVGVPPRVPTRTPTRAPQGPTIHPTRSPAFAPTVHPSAAPTMQKGWLSISQYEGESCLGRVTTVTSVPTSTCLELYGSDLSVAGSVHYICRGDGTATVSYYSDSACRKLTRESLIFMGCAYRVANYYDSEDYASTEVNCAISSDQTTPPLPDYSGAYAIERSYNSLVGCEGQVSEVEAVLQDYCFNIDQRAMSYKLHLPNLIVYNSLDCRASKEVSRNPLNVDCRSALASDTDDDDGGNVGDDWDDDNGRSKLQDSGFISTNSSASSSKFSARGPIKSMRIQKTKVQADDDDYTYGDDATTDMFNIWAVANTAPFDLSTFVPSLVPSQLPSFRPTARPSSRSPSIAPITLAPTTGSPVTSPTSLPSSSIPAIHQEDDSTSPPTNYDDNNNANDEPSPLQPSSFPTVRPSQHTNSPSVSPSQQPSRRPSPKPTAHPSVLPSVRPSPHPSIWPSAAAPSVKPSAHPTLMPISLNPATANISITLQHVLSGISMDGWKNGIDKNVAVITYAVTTSLALKSSSSVVFISATELASSAAVAIKDSASQVVVKYKVLIDLADTSYSTVPSAMQAVQTTMADDVAKGKFDALVHRYAAAMQSSSLMAVSSTSVAVVSVDAVSGTDPTTGSSNHDPKDAAGGASAAVIVTLVLLVMALTILCSTVRWSSVKSMFSRSSSQRSLYSHVSLNSDSLHGSIVPRRASRNVADEDGDVEIELSTVSTQVQPPTDKAFVKDKTRDDVINPLAADSAIV